MPRSDFDVSAYASELLKDAQDLPAEKRAVLEEVLSDDRIKNRLADSVLRQQDYSRQTQQIAASKRELEAKNNELTNWYTQQLNTVKQNQEEYERMQSQLKAYAERYGEEDMNRYQQPTVPQQDLSKFVPRDVFDSELARIQNQGIQLMAEIDTLQSRHYHEFKEPLDMIELKNKAVEQGMTLQQAYEQSVADKRSVVREAKRKEELEAAREEGRRSALSGLRLPATNDNDIVHPLMAREKLGNESSNVPAWRKGVAEYADGTLQKEVGKYIGS